MSELNIRPAYGRTLKFFMSRSIFLHLFIIALFFGISKLLNIRSENRIKASLILVQSAVRIDMVAMPELTIKELRNIKPMDLGGAPDSVANRPAKKISQNKNKIEFKKKSKKPLSFMERMKLLSKKSTAKNKSKSQKKSTTSSSKIDKRRRKELQDLILAGNKLSKGSSTTGAGAGATGTIYQQYIQRLPDLIKPHWKLPSYLIEKGLQCRIRIFLSSTGRILKADVYESSGDNEYDRKALEAVRSSSPFPSIARGIRLRASRGDIVLGFPL